VLPPLGLLVAVIVGSSTFPPFLCSGVRFASWQSRDLGAMPEGFSPVDFSSAELIAVQSHSDVSVGRDCLAGLATAMVAGAGCGIVLWLSGWRVVRDETSEDERRRRRTFLLGRTVAAALAGITVGLLPMLVLIYAAFTATVSIAVEWASVLVLYAGSAVLTYGYALLGVWWVLAGSGDDRRPRPRGC